MITRRIVTEDDARLFFETSVNTIEDSIGSALIDIKEKKISFDFNSVLLLHYKDIYAESFYEIDSPLFDKTFVSTVHNILSEEPSEKSTFTFIRKVDEDTYTFDIKISKYDDSFYHLIFICHEKLFDTENQLGILSKLAGSGLSLFAGSTWWIDNDKHQDKFFQSDTGPRILGIPISKDKLYTTSVFQEVRNKAKIVSDVYQSSINSEQASYDRVRNNETDYFAGRTPTISNSDKIIWVEAYGKCILRYPDGSPRLFIAIDIYMSDLQEEKTQLDILNNLIDHGLLNSDVGVWYYQRHFLDGKYYFTHSYQKLMSDEKLYKDDSVSNIVNEQIELMTRNGNGYENYLHDFKKIHNSIFSRTRDKYHIIIPNFKNNNTLNWIEVRGTVIERDEAGHVVLFVGVNVDVTESHMRNRELERLRLQNEKLQLAERLAIKARNLMVWYHHQQDDILSRNIFGNEMFESQLGIKRDAQGLIKIRDVISTLVREDEESKAAARTVVDLYKNLYRLDLQALKSVISKHKNRKTKEIIYIEHSVEVAEYNADGSIRLIGGILLDVTKTILYQKQIKYLADYDTLTNVYNRNYFEKFITESLPPSYSVIVFDLDGLKLVNDVFGHLEGDKIISKLADLLKIAFHDRLFISRIGGDEFIVITEDIGTNSVRQMADKLESVVADFNETSKIEMNVSKGGKSVINNDLSFDKAFVMAENIMYRSKLNNRSSRKSKVLESILETLNAKTEETKEHSDRVAMLAIKTMSSLGFVRASEIEDIKLLSRVHDIGKITIDDNILKKPTSLTSEEYEMIKKHSEAGYKIIRNITDSDDVCNGVLLHHERWDGTGYPQGLRGKDIPIFARIISVVDSFDAMTNDRIYSKKKSLEEAVAELKRCSGTQFDPRIVKAFLGSCFNIKV